MKNKEFYQETFEQVRPAGKIRWEEMEQRGAQRRLRGKIAVLAAVVCLLAGISTVAAANGWFGLRELEFQESAEVRDPDGTVTEELVFTGLISLQGYSDTPEYRAMEEWKAFLDSYDDGGLLEQLGNDPSGFEEEYGLYLVYSQEMADAFDRILEKYGLRKHTDMIDDLYTNEDLCVQVGGDFLGENQAYSSYMYEDGTFKFDGEIELADYGTLDYQFMRCVRGSFTDVLLSVGDLRDYREWIYETVCGVPVTLALGPFKALIVADLPDSFVTINVLAGEESAPQPFSSGAVMEEDLERFADSFDFSILTPVQKPVIVDVEPEPGEIPPEEDLFLLHTGVREAAAQEFYTKWITFVENGEREQVLELVLYPVTVTVAEGNFTAEKAEDLLPYYDAIFTKGLLEADMVNRYTKEWADLITNDGLIGAAGGAVWMAPLEDGIRIFTVQNAEGWSIRPVGEPGITAG